MYTIRNRKKLYKSFTTHLILHFSILITFALLVLGCGKKAPPVPPREKKPPAVNDLSTSIDGDTLKLTWTIPKEKGRIMPDLSGFIVYRSKMLLPDSDCEVCPVPFKRVADILTKVSASGYIKKGNCSKSCGNLLLC
ncbi:MAG: hypothetical protein JRI72_02275 [Deltaproteobacteria bacterium]|nr:hypothetical protein [Deltaproteobacteria bacterium]